MTRSFTSDLIFEKYGVIEEIGRGCYSIVYKGMCHITNQLVSLKVSNKTPLRSKREQIEKMFKNEINILKDLNHRNILHIIDFIEIPNRIISVFELMKGRNLNSYITEKKFLSEEEARILSLQILEGLSYIHSQKIVHLDLKPDNLMFRDETCKELVILDFGVSMKLNQGEKKFALQGTINYTAPEVLNYSCINFHTDMWSFGVILYFMVFGVQPFDGIDDKDISILIEKAHVSFDVKEFSQISPLVINLMKSLLLKDGRKRLTADQCLEHDWFIKERTTINSDKKRENAFTYMIRIFAIICIAIFSFITSIITEYANYFKKNIQVLLYK